MDDGKKYKHLSVVHYSIAGACSGFITRAICQPLDVLKIRFQLQTLSTEQQPAKYRFLIQALCRIVREEGAYALWKGHVPAQALSVIFGSVQFGSYEISRRKMREWFPFYSMHNASFKYMSDFLCGGLAGVCSSVICQPFDVLRTRLVAQGEPKQYKGILHAIQLMSKESGIRTFYKGMVPTLAMIFPNMGLHFAFYESFKQAWDTTVTRMQFSEHPKLKQLSCGALAGLCSKVILLPLDVAKKRLQYQGFHGGTHYISTHYTYSGLVDCLITMTKAEGVAALFKGAGPSVAKSILTASLTFFTYEQCCDIMNQYLSKRDMGQSIDDS